MTIADLPGCLKQFLDHEKNISIRVRAPAEKEAYSGRENLRAKALALLKKQSIEEIYSACSKDPELRRLVTRIAKERKLVDRKREPSVLLLKYVPPFLQGGAPGLGKKS